jgi:sulfatase maturation enzyme AslB (radical SAM superfamily)
MKYLTRKIVFCCVATCLAVSPLMATSESLKPIAEYQAHYDKKWTALVLQLEQDQDASTAQKIVSYQQKIGEMEQIFERQRLADYQQLEVTETVETICRGKSPRTKIFRNQVCATKCVERPNKDMYTSTELVKFEGPTQGELVTDTKACFRLETRRVGTQKGSVTAKFKYSDIYINQAISQDAKVLLNTY